MKLPHGFLQQYTAALESQLSDVGEAALHQAYELGRRALAEGLSVLDIVLLHHQALGTLMLDKPEDDERARLENAAEFLAECLSPFEMTMLGYREQNQRLIGLNDKLHRANEETNAALAKLAAETTERRRVEQALWQAQKLQAVGRLAGGVAHHFNNLLTVILGNLDMVRGLVGSGVPAELMLARALHAAERGAKVTRHLLSFSGQQTLNPEIVSPSARLPDLATLLGGTLRGDVIIETSLPTDLWPIEVDVGELELALLNLGVNSRDAMPEGGTLRIAAENRTIDDPERGLAGDFVVIEVSDTGTGIPADILPRVFDPFFTTKEIGYGSGLGLSQVHGFTQQAGGKVELTSEAGRGTTVRLYLPARPHAATKPPREPRRAAQGQHTHRVKGTILIVEDDVDIADLVATGLQRCGFTVKLAYRAAAALELLHSGQTVDLVFSDVVMPDGMSGIELADLLRNQYPAVPVLLATGYSEALSSADARGLQVISKPYRARDVCDTVTEIIEHKLYQVP